MPTDGRGEILNGNKYVNQALSMTIALPGEWHFIGKATPDPSGDKSKSSSCSGALCGGLRVNVSLGSRPEEHPTYTIFLGAYKLSAEYRDRQKYPLRRFAESMTLKSLGNKWIPEGELTCIKLSGLPAYRLYVRNRANPTAKGLLYVSESNGHVFLLVGTALSNPDILGWAIEKMVLGS